MKRKIFFAIIILSLGYNSLKAHTPELLIGFPIVEDNKWTAFQVNIWPVKLFSHEAVYGINLSPSLSLSIQYDIYGISVATLGTMSKNVIGLQASPYCLVADATGVSVGVFNTIQNNYGAMIGVVNINKKVTFTESEKTKNYVQIGLYNQAANGLQIGVLNYNPNSWIPWMIGFNFSLKN